MTAMLDWLERDPREPHMVAVGDTRLPVVIRRLANARRITLRLAPDGSEARVSMPRWARTRDALQFAQSRADWLGAQLAALPKKETPGNGTRLRFRGEWLVVAHSPDARRRPDRRGDTLHAGGPGQSLPARLKRWLEGEARELLAGDLTEYCARIGREAPKLALSNARRRWGSCGPDGTIRINWRLVMAPDFVRRSVVAHEVAHLVHFDHSPRFHALLGEIYEADIKAANRWLKQEGRSLYAPFG
jgi:hypothetical protein